MSSAFVNDLKAFVNNGNWSTISKYLDTIDANNEDDPGVAIDAAKSMIEAVAKTILADKELTYEKNINLNKLTKMAVSSVDTLDQDEQTIKKIISALCTVSQCIGEVRNEYSVIGHGQDIEMKKAEVYLADLAINASCTVVRFLVSLHSRHPRDMKRLCYDAHESFNNWYDRNNPLNLSDADLSASRALFDQDGTAYVEAFHSFENSPEDLVDSIENDPINTGTISSLAQLSESQQLLIRQAFSNIDIQALSEKIQPTMDILKSDLKSYRVQAEYLSKLMKSLKVSSHTIMEDVYTAKEPRDP